MQSMCMNFNNAVWIPVFQRHCNWRGLLLLVLVMMPTVLIVSKNPDCVNSPCFEISLLLALLSVSAPFLLYLNRPWDCPSWSLLSLGRVHGGTSWSSSLRRGDCPSIGHLNSSRIMWGEGPICYVCSCQHFLDCAPQWPHKLWFLWA